jgi:alanine racemase
MILKGKPEIGSKPRVWLEISKDKLRSNFNIIADYVSPLQVMAVLKADAYGLGAAQLASIFSQTKASCFGVAEVNYALEIKPLGLPIHILGGIVDEEVPVVVQEGFIAPITDLRIARLLSAEAVHRRKDALCQLVIDTGMGRLGIQYQNALETVREIFKLPGLNIIGIYSHFPFAYGDKEFSGGQVEKFLELLHSLEEDGITFQLVHIANSDGIHNIPEAVQEPFNMVRTGINLYGAYDAEGDRAFELEQVMELKSRLVAVRDLPAGASVGYGRTYILDRPKRIGTVSIGYADGVPFGIPGEGQFIVRENRCPVVGRISMDFTTIDLDGVPDAAVGDEVVCLGQGITVHDWARIKNSITYEIICSFGSRVERCYV